MSYSINGKVYTDHPLLDEIVYNCKLILDGLVVKNDVLANSYETQESLENAETLMIIKNNNMSLSLCPFTYDSLIAFGYDRKLANSCLIDYNNVPEEDREEIINFTSNYFLEHFEEKNKYYRMLMGLPEYGTNEYNVYIDDSYFPVGYDKEIDFSKPLHEMDSGIISTLENYGKIDELLETYRGSNYSYIRFLGNKSLDIYDIRKASKWDILYMPPVESLVEDRFKELYNLNKDVYLKRTYQEAYAFSSKYYEQCMILMVICQTFTDMVVDVPEWYIRRDIFDIRSVQYFLDSYGVKFFKEIPLKYQIRIVKNLNKLIKYKSSNRNNIDILEIFSLKDTSIYKYYLYKKRKTDEEGNYIEGDNESDKYDLEFVQCKLGDTYDNYIKDKIYRTPYDDITYQDKYWDGEDSHQYIKDLHLNRDFTIESTKYMSLEYNISSSEYFYQMQYFLGLILNSDLDSDDLSIGIPSIQQSTTFKLSNLFLFLSLLSLGYDNANTDIIRPKTLDNIKENLGFNSDDHLYDWMKKYYPEVFVKDSGRVYGFNSDVNIDELSEIINRVHSQYQFYNGFTLKELGVDSYIIPSKVSSIEELLYIYKNNTKCYNNLKDKMVNNSDDRDEFVVMQFVFDSLFTKQFDYDFYKVNGEDSNNLELILKDRDFTLYNVYKKITSDQDIESKRDNIRNIMNDIVNTLDYYLGADGLEHIFAFTSVSSFNSLINYIYLMINFFKSYKVYFLNPYTTYSIDDPLENFVGARDSISERRLEFVKDDKQFHRDVISLNSSLEYNEKDFKNVIETLDIYGQFDPDPDDDYDYDAMYAEDSGIYFKDADGGNNADNVNCIPFIVLNGKAAQEDIKDLFDINGADVLDNMLFDYFDLDAGNVYNIENYEDELYNENMFSYTVDGGSSYTDSIYTDSMHVKVIDNQNDLDVRVSTRYYFNIEEKYDGLYLHPMLSCWSKFEDLGMITSDTFEFYSSLYNITLDPIKIGEYNKNDNEYIEECVKIYSESDLVILNSIDKWALERRLFALERKIRSNTENIDELGDALTSWNNFI